MRDIFQYVERKLNWKIIQKISSKKLLNLLFLMKVVDLGMLNFSQCCAY